MERHDGGRLLAFVRSLPKTNTRKGRLFFSLFLHVLEESDRIYNQRKNCDYKHRDIVTCHVPRAS